MKTDQLAKKLATYSSLASFTLLAHQAKAQIIYTDIQDTTIKQSDRTPYCLDLNNDGIIDYTLGIRDNEGVVIDEIYDYNFCDGQAQSNSIVGKYHTYNMPRKLKFGKEIGPDITILPVGSYCDFLRFGTPSSQFGFWGGGVLDGYLGVKFHGDGKTYYGWVRMDIKKNGLQMRVKDYAYEASGNSILAGDNGMNRNAIDDKNPEISLYPNPASDFIVISGLTDASAAVTCNIINLQGQIIKSTEQASSDNIRIDITDLQDGIYILTLNSSGQMKELKFAVKRS